MLSRRPSRISLPMLALILTAGAGWLVAAGPAGAQCPTEPPLENYTGGGQVACPCFVPNEQAGAVFEAPPSHYPLEIVSVGFGWGSQFGGSPQVLEQAINIYAAGLPNPGVPIFTLSGPTLDDGFINEFDIDALPGQVIINSGEFTVAMEFLNQSAGDPFAPSVVHDGNGCQPGKNVVFAIPGGWNDACVLGVTGDWVMFVTYRPLNCGGTDPDPVLSVASANPASVFMCPAGDGEAFGSTGATISVVVNNDIGSPLAGIPANDIWIESVNPGELTLCNGGLIADGPTDLAGSTTISGTPAGGGCVQGGLRVVVGGIPITSSVIPIQINSVDRNGDGNVALADVGAFAAEYLSSYFYCSDFVDDGALNLVDVGQLASHLGHSCP